MRRLPLLASLLLACRLLPAPTPMAQTSDRRPGPTPARCLMVLLPGAGDDLKKFSEEGFITAIRESGLSIDIVTADATIGYYFRGTLTDRLERDVLAPHRPGHAHVWLLGISMGGFGALHTAQLHPEQIVGVAVFAPYLGKRKLAAEIQHAGGLARWTPDPAAPPTRKTYQRQLWSWLHRTTAAGAPGPAILLGFGDDDRSPGRDVLAAALPPDRFFHTPGDHDWPTWRVLLARLLAHPTLTASCAADKP